MRVACSIMSGVKDRRSKEQADQKGSPSVMAREQLQDLLAGGVDRETNIVSALVETVTRLVVQELLEGEQQDFLGSRGRYDRRNAEQAGARNGYPRGRLRTAEGFVDVAVPQVRGAAGPFRSGLRRPGSLALRTHHAQLGSAGLTP
jgi:hypothetical protein